MRLRIQNYTAIALAAFVFTFLNFQRAEAQCVVSILNTTSDTLDVPCGATVQLERDTLGAYALFTDFNNGQVGLGWQTTSNADLSNPCGPGSNGSTYLWFGNTSTAPRNLRTTPMNLSCGAEVCFELRFSVQGGAQPCEGPDLAGEGVTFEYSVNGGTTWTTINYFQPNTNGSFNSLNPGSGDYTAWATYCYILPPAASVPNVELRWQQYASTAAVNDHWGLDSITVRTFCGGVSNVWSTSPIDTNQFVTTGNILSPIPYWVTRIVQPSPGSMNTTPDTCYDTIVVQPQLPQIPISPLLDPVCTGDESEIFVDFANAQFIDTTVNYSFQWSPAGILDTTALDYARKNSLTQDTTVFYTTNHPVYPQCSFTDTIRITQAGVKIDSFNLVDPRCYFEQNPSGEVNYFWSDNLSRTVSTLTTTAGGFVGSDTTRTNFSNLGPGSYILVVSDNQCRDTLNFTITAPDTLFLADTNLVAEICQESGTDQTVGVINGIAPYTYFWDTDSTTNATFTVQSDVDTTFSIFALDSIGCSTDTVDYTFVLPDPISIAQIDTIICERVILPMVAEASGGIGNYTYLWSTGDSTKTILTRPVIGGDDYTVTVFDGCMEPATMTATLDFYANPEVGIVRVFEDTNNTDQDITTSDEAEVIVGYTPFTILFQPEIKDDSYSYFWDMWNNGSAADAGLGWPVTSNPGDVDASFSYEKEGEYLVMLVTTTDEGCIDTTFALHEVLFRGDPPNVFTPNGDGVNDYFFIPGSEAIRDFKLEIYNRWGRQVFETTNANSPQNGGGWDGEGHQDGVYFYIATGKRGNGEAFMEKGTITLVGSGN